MLKLPPNPFKDFPKIPKLSQIILKKANPVRGVIDDARQLIKAGKSEISEIASALRVEGYEKPAETKEEESCPVCSSLTNLKEYLGRRKVEKALSELETGDEGKKKSVETVRKYIEGEDVG